MIIGSSDFLTFALMIVVIFVYALSHEVLKKFYCILYFDSLFIYITITLKYYKIKKIMCSETYSAIIFIVSLLKYNILFKYIFK